MCLPEGITPSDLYIELRGMAAMYLANESNARTLQPTALIHEAFLRVIGPSGLAATKLSRADFFARAANCMRLVLIDHARRKQAAKRTGPDLGLHSEATTDAAIDVLEVEEALDKLEQLDPRAVETLRLRHYLGLTTQEAAIVLGVSDSTVEKDCRVARAWLKEHLGQEKSLRPAPNQPEQLPRK